MFCISRKIYGSDMSLAVVRLFLGKFNNLKR